MSVTRQQLERIAAGGGRLPDISSIIGLQNLFGDAGKVPTAAEQDVKLKEQLAGTCE